MSMSGFLYRRGLARIGAKVATAGIRIAALGLAQISPSHWYRVAGLLMTLMIAGAGWAQTQAGSTHKGPPQSVIHGPSYYPPYAAILLDDNSGLGVHEATADEPSNPPL